MQTRCCSPSSKWLRLRDPSCLLKFLVLLLLCVMRRCRLRLRRLSHITRHFSSPWHHSHYQSEKPGSALYQITYFEISPLEASLLRCAAAGVSIYSPHTSLDSAKHGVNDWLASAFGLEASSTPIEQKINEEPGIGIGRLVNLHPPLPFSSIIPLIKSHLGLKHGLWLVHACIAGLIQVHSPSCPVIAAGHLLHSQ